MNVSPTVLYFAFWMRSTECEELPRNDPVKVSVFCSLIVLIFLHVEFGEVQPAVLQSLEDGCEGAHWIMTMTQQGREINTFSNDVPCGWHGGSPRCSDCTCRFQMKHLWNITHQYSIICHFQNTFLLLLIIWFTVNYITIALELPLSPPLTRLSDIPLFHRHAVGGTVPYVVQVIADGPKKKFCQKITNFQMLIETEKDKTHSWIQILYIFLNQ